MGWDAGEIHHETLDGLETIWCESSGPFEVGIVFRVGIADEDFPRHGITHLVEHLALPGPTIGFDDNGWVESIFTTFWASGREELAMGHLTEACRRLADLPVEDLERERSVLAAETELRTASDEGTALAVRYGAVAHGLAGFRQVGLEWLGADAVTAWARDRFTLANAVLYATRRPTVDPALPLPSGRRVAAPEPAPLAGRRFPAASDEGTPGRVSLSVAGPGGGALGLGVRILTRRILARLRHELGLSYAVQFGHTRLSAGVTHSTIGADVLTGRERDAAKEVVRLQRELVEAGPTEAELAAERAEIGREEEDPYQLAAALNHRACAALLGCPVLGPGDEARSLEGLGPREVADALGAALEAGGLLTVPDHDVRYRGFDYTSPQLDQESLGPEERRFRRPGRRRRSDHRLLAGEAGLRLEGGGDGDGPTIRFADCVGLVREPDGTRTLVRRDGQVITVVPREWRDGEDLARLMDAGVSTDLQAVLGRPPSASRPPEPASGHEAARVLQAVLRPGEKVVETGWCRLRARTPAGETARRAGAAVGRTLAVIVAGHLEPDERMAVGVTDRRLLVLTRDGLTVHAKRLAAVRSVDVTDPPATEPVSVMTIGTDGPAIVLSVERDRAEALAEAIRAGIETPPG